MKACLLAAVSALVVAFTAALAHAQASAPPESSCSACHRQQRDPRLRAPVDELPGSVHGAKQVGCADCHGGRPGEPSIKAHDRTAGFRARVAAGAEPEVCGDCHAKIEHGAGAAGAALTDPLALYQGSVHGKARAAGNARAANCASCHGAHSIRPASDPASRVNPRSVAQTCSRCHSDPALAASVGLPHDQYAQWQRSVHGQAFTASQAEAGTEAEGAHPAGITPPTCNDCHDDHAVRQRDHTVSRCRNCHAAESKAFAASPHAKAFERMGFVPCVDCHGSHEVSRANASLIGLDAEASCRRCHAEGQAQFATIAALAVEVRAAEAAARRAREGLHLPVAKAASVLRGLDAAQATLGEAVHTLDPQRIGEAARALAAQAAAVPKSSAGSGVWLGASRGNLLMVALLAVLGAAALWLALFAGRRDRP